uniref:Peptidase A1 domain-containing protein n=1 Tax=Araucaria cunninghamii TaxID=56994 RepID=A0A0D6QX38_ARACU
MAKVQPLAAKMLQLSLFFFIFVAAAFARDFPARSTLDVRAALQEVRGEAKRYEAEQTLGPRALPLVHRDDIVFGAASETPTYGERMRQRLKRDAARVAAINSRLELAVQGVKASSLKPQSYDNKAAAATAGFESPVISGIDQGSGEYFTRVGVGSPPHDQLVVLDTGSDIIWIQCEPCTDCYQQSDPIFNPGLSSSYNGIRCDSNLCQELDVSGCTRNGTCMYQVNYGDGSYTVGNFATETLTLGKTPVGKVAIGCGHDNEGLFVAASGLLGLGGGALSFPSQLPQADDKIFSYCLVNRDSGGSSSLEFGRQAVPAGAAFAPMVKNSRLDTFYYVSLSGISVGGNMLSIPQSVFQLDASGNGGLIVDSGTAVTRLQRDAYSSLRDAFVAGTKDLPATDGISLFDTCYDLSGKDSVNVPTIAFHFPSGGSVSLPAKNYLVPVDTTGTFCFAFAPTSSTLSIVGNIQQQGMRVSFDPVNSQVGFAVSKC